MVSADDRRDMMRSLRGKLLVVAGIDGAWSRCVQNAIERYSQDNERACLTMLSSEFQGRVFVVWVVTSTLSSLCSAMAMSFAMATKKLGSLSVHGHWISNEHEAITGVEQMRNSCGSVPHPLLGECKLRRHRLHPEQV